MLSTESRAELDVLWSDFWPATEVKPLAVIDFINSVFFLRYLETIQEQKEQLARAYNNPLESSIYPEDQQRFRWSVFQQMDKNQLYQLFNKPENNVLQFARATEEYKRWPRFDDGQTPLLALPELLLATVRMVAKLEVANADTRDEMNKYLLGQVQAASQKQTDALAHKTTGESPVKEQRSFMQSCNVAVILLVIFISGFALAYFYFGSKNKLASTSITKNTGTDTAIIPLQADNKVKAGIPEKEITQKKQSQKETAVAKPKATTKKKALAIQKDMPGEEVKGKYKIVSKAYFHNEPDESTRRNAFVVHWNNSYATLNALDEENGFVYVVFRNHQNQTSKGWLRKKDLKPID